MSRLAIMPLEDYQNLCNNIRELTGTTDVIKSGDLVEKVGDVAESGEDVTDETNVYTNKLATLETAITALETELEGKTSGGGTGGWINVASLPMALAVVDDPGLTYYYEVPENCIGVIFIGLIGTFSNVTMINTGITRKINNVFSNFILGTNSLVVEDADGTGTVLKITNAYDVAYLLPILSSDLP